MKFNYVMIAMMLIGLMSCTVDKELKEQLQGEWLLTNTSGGIAGTGFTAEWNIVKINDGEFELYNDFTDALVLIASGEIQNKIETTEEEIFEFNVTSNELDESLPLEQDSEKMIEIDGDKMTWIAPCCDRFSYHLEKN